MNSSVNMPNQSVTSRSAVQHSADSDTIAVCNSISKRYASMSAPAVDQASFNIQRQKITALLGGSGSGKSTILRLLAGLEVPDAGKITIDGHVVSDGPKFVPPEQRGIGLVFQDYALFPHLTVQQNIAFGLNKKRANLETHLKSMLDLVELGDLGKRYPHELSGGQRQRVAIARALAPQPKLLLLDEPFSNLDDALKSQVRRDLTRIIRAAEMTAIFVTHDVRDVFAVADQLIVLDNGRVRQVGAPRQVYQQPYDPTIARIFGETTILKAQKLRNLARCEFGTIDLGVDDFPNDIVICLRPADLCICSQDTELGLNAIVEQLTFFGTHNELRLRLLVHGGGGRSGQTGTSNLASDNSAEFLTIPIPCSQYFKPGTALKLGRASDQIHYWPI